MNTQGKMIKNEMGDEQLKGKVLLVKRYNKENFLLMKKRDENRNKEREGRRSANLRVADRTDR